ncbi:3-hydroxybutyrate oligomer hydrolase family protein [Pseudomonas batumici]|uniref:FkbW n=1 Tax=Pseudomonas batumici TaxID=226910 RepID=A0A0C2E754_9PSED|nr:3-hydroxybutyrate oligomer hydrolase family protein [Pseudomonas batumici]KIH81739.1 FkbW [Pseudomonas batumici]
MWKSTAAALAPLILAGAATAGTLSPCERMLKKLDSQLADASCVESPDLTTRNPGTTPADNSLPGLPPLAFMPQADRAILVANAASRPPIKKAVPGLQIQARFAKDPQGQARFLLRLPKDWNGSLVVAGASGARSEFNGDFVWSDYVLQKGYAYASQNKGVLSAQASTAADPLACRTGPADKPSYVHYYDDDPGQEFARWRDFMVMAADLARLGVQAQYGHEPRYTYAVGTSNGGYQVRRAIETAPEYFDGGVDWEGTFIDPRGPSLLTDLPPAILNYPDYLASGRSPTSTAALNIMAAGYPPDLVADTASGPASLWGSHAGSFWEPTQCQWQKRLDPTYNTYGAGPGRYNYLARLSASTTGENVAAIATSGKIKRPLITVAGTMDALLPIDHHARAYARQVAAQGGEHAPAYRLYEIQNGNHVESYANIFPQLELIEPHAQHAFDLLVRFVEQKAPLPPDQCVARGGAITDAPAQAGHCPSLLVP